MISTRHRFRSSENDEILALDTGGLSPDAAAIIAMQWDDGDDVSILALETIVPSRSMGAGAEVGRSDNERGVGVGRVGWFGRGRWPGSWTKFAVGIATMKRSRKLAACLRPILRCARGGGAAFDAERATDPNEKGVRKISRRRNRFAVARDTGAVPSGRILWQDILRTPLHRGRAKEWIASAKTHVDAAYCQMLADGMDAPLILCGAGTDGLDLSRRQRRSARLGRNRRFASGD
jgi:hypothetical protein